MMRKTYNLILIICSLFYAQGVAAKQTSAALAQIKSLIEEKKVEEAVTLLRDSPARFLKTEDNRRDVTEWLGLFIYDETLNHYQKAQETAKTSPIEAEEEFKKAVALEPYNMNVLRLYITWLIDQKKIIDGRELLDRVRKQAPFLAIFNVYSSHLQIVEGQPAESLNCENQGLQSLEKDYCYLVRLLGVVASPQSPKQKQRDANGFFSKTRLPDALWAMGTIKSDKNLLKKYLSTCQGLSEQDKKQYKTIPDVCGKADKVKEELEKPPEQSAETE